MSARVCLKCGTVDVGGPARCTRDGCTGRTRPYGGVWTPRVNATFEPIGPGARKRRTLAAAP